MKKLYLALSLLACTFANGHAQTILDEGFEGYEQRDTTYYAKDFPEGWTYEGSGVSTKSDYYTWAVETYGRNGSYPSMSGHAWLYMDAPTYDGDPRGGFGPRTERLLTNELTLDNTYQLTFDWKAAPAYVNDYKSYTLKVYAVNSETNAETLLLDIADEKSRKASGVTSFDTWDQHQSKLDLSAFQGQTIRIAFDYVMLKTTGNALWIDNVKVTQGASITSPIAQSSLTQYQFQKMYIGEKHYSEPFTIKNVGAKGLKVTGFEAPEGISLSGDTAGIDLDINESASLQLAYKASLTSPTSGNAVIKTNGGDVTIPFTATKEAVPAGYQLELFESFPPAGWTAKGWDAISTALEGDKSAYSAASYDDMLLTSPRLDLSDPTAPHQVMFTYYNEFESEEGGTYASNDISFWVSTDGGKTWKDSIWTTVYDDMSTYNSIQNVTIDLSKYTSDNVKVRWKNPASVVDSETGAGEYSYFFLDRVLLPNVYGADGVPFGIAYTTPKDEATDVFYKSIRFEWKPAQFAESYKLYVGTSEDNFDVVNGEDVGDITTYTLAAAPAGTKLYWKVTGVNSVGDETDAPVWSFTTQADNSVTTFPWFEGFENNETTMPLGWYAENVSKYSAWTISNYYPYEGKYLASASGRATGDSNILYSPDVKLPADGQYQISFWWGNDNAINLKKDPNNVRTNTFNMTDNSADYGTFEIFADGKWTQLDRISDDSEDDNRYWLRDAFDLTPYAGKTVQFRWTYTVTNYAHSNALVLDNVEIKSLSESSVSFNTTGWNAYKVNYNGSVQSDVIAVANLGGQDVTVNSVSFENPNFTTTLAEGTVIPAGSSQTFNITFNAGTTATADSISLTDNMTLALSDGTTIKLPVAGIALAQDIRFFGFEQDVTGGVPNGFTGINADGTATEGIMFWTTPNLHEGAPLSFVVLNDSECYNSLKGAHGHQSLMTRCNSAGAADDWLVSQKYGITDQTTVDFDARAWESVNSVLPADAPTFKVLVSETSATDRKTFTQVGSNMKTGLYNDIAWPHYSVDLSAYAGKSVYIAIQAVYSNCLGGFLDNVEFDHINLTETGIDNVTVDGTLDENQPMFNLAGQRVQKTYKGIVLQNGKKFIKK